MVKYRRSLFIRCLYSFLLIRLPRSSVYNPSYLGWCPGSRSEEGEVRRLPPPRVDAIVAHWSSAPYPSVPASPYYGANLEWCCRWDRPLGRLGCGYPPGGLNQTTASPLWTYYSKALQWSNLAETASIITKHSSNKNKNKRDRC